MTQQACSSSSFTPFLRKATRPRIVIGELELTDFNMDDFLASGMMGDFFHEMMAETGMGEDMMAELGGDVNMGGALGSLPPGQHGKP